jgi:hypothetical protein
MLFDTFENQKASLCHFASLPEHSLACLSIKQGIGGANIREASLIVTKLQTLIIASIAHLLNVVIKLELSVFNGARNHLIFEILGVPTNITDVVLVVEKEHRAIAIDCNQWTASSHLRGVHFVEESAPLFEIFRVEVLNELIGVRHCYLLLPP